MQPKSPFSGETQSESTAISFLPLIYNTNGFNHKQWRNTILKHNKPPIPNQENQNMNDTNRNTAQSHHHSKPNSHYRHTITKETKQNIRYKQAIEFILVRTKDALEQVCFSKNYIACLPSVYVWFVYMWWSAQTSKIKQTCSKASFVRTKMNSIACL